MQIILREDVEKLGTRGQMVKVANGYARNFLIPNKKAVAATAANVKIVEQERQAALRRDAKEKTSAEELGKLMSGVTIVSVQKAGEADQLFGSVTSKDIADMLEKQGYNIDRKKIMLEAPVKTLGEHKIGIKLYRDVVTEITLVVNKDESAQ
jgi:large subunit ribosomal protein L9